jgi:uncharacterized protein, YhcH/YjgK/YiaL family
MLFGNMKTYDAIGDSAAVTRVLIFLRDMATELADGRHDLRDGIHILAKEYEPGDAAAKRFETHAKYADVQYMVSGGESVFVAPREGLTIVENRLDSDDVRFHAEPDPAAVSEFRLGEGDFLILLPGDAHKAECSIGIARCRKCIAKIPVELL